MCRGRAQLIRYRNFEGAGFTFGTDFVVPDTVVPVRDSAGKQIGTATLEPAHDGLWAEVVFDYSTPERLDGQLGKLFALPRGKLRMPAQSVPACIEAEDGPAAFPRLQIEEVDLEAVILTGRTQFSGRDPVEIMEDPA